ncbi:MAG: hypothetical protein Kow006_15580 [Gammaproteobacteria bacterium]
MADENKSYDGPERRVEQRRKIPDRRQMVRFEPEKEPRRKLKGRRKEDGADVWDRRDI